jgi:hypothetical protein
VVMVSVGGFFVFRKVIRFRFISFCKMKDISVLGLGNIQKNENRSIPRLGWIFLTNVFVFDRSKLHKTYNLGFNTWAILVKMWGGFKVNYIVTLALGSWPSLTQKKESGLGKCSNTHVPESVGEWVPNPSGFSHFGH